MSWQNNLFSNLLVVGILLSLALIVYCKIKNVTVIEIIKQIKDATSSNE